MSTECIKYHHVSDTSFFEFAIDSRAAAERGPVVVDGFIHCGGLSQRHCNLVHLRLRHSRDNPSEFKECVKQWLRQSLHSRRLHFEERHVGFWVLLLGEHAQDQAAEATGALSGRDIFPETLPHNVEVTWWIVREYVPTQNEK